MEISLAAPAPANSFAARLIPARGRDAKRAKMSTQRIVPAACIRVSSLLLLLSSLSGGVTYGQSSNPLPSGNNGIAAKYPGDSNIKSDPNVIFADDFESYSSEWQLWGKWDNIYHQQDVQITTDPANVFSGQRSLQMRVPAQSSEVANAVDKHLNPTRDIVFVRVYTKFVAGYDVSGSEHNGISMSSKYCCPGVPANGTNKFFVDVENGRDLGSANPGFTNSYVYYPEQRGSYGDHWFPDGIVLPFSNTPGNFGPYFVPRPNFIPALNRWYCYELMVKANTPGLRDGRVAIWIDGALIADFQNVRLRDANTLKIDKVSLSLYIKANTVPTDAVKWYDNVVIATSYIGPISPATLAPPTNVSVVVK
jgi:hypothetical protein